MGRMRSKAEDALPIGAAWSIGSSSQSHESTIEPLVHPLAKRRTARILPRFAATDWEAMRAWAVDL
jgi:hypothetical protein